MKKLFVLAAAMAFGVAAMAAETTVSLVNPLPAAKPAPPAVVGTYRGHPLAVYFPARYKLDDKFLFQSQDWKPSPLPAEADPRVTVQIPAWIFAKWTAEQWAACDPRFCNASLAANAGKKFDQR